MPEAHDEDRVVCAAAASGRAHHAGVVVLHAAAVHADGDGLAVDRGFEREVRKRLDYWAELRRKRAAASD